MKVYVGLQKITKNDEFRYGMTVYKNTGAIAYEISKKTAILDNKFDNALEAFMWVVKHLNTLYHKGILPDKEKVELFMDNHVLYNWIVSESAPYPYTIALADLLFEFSFMQLTIELIYSKNCKNRVTWRNTEEEKLTSVLEMFSLQGITKGNKSEKAKDAVGAEVQ